MYPYERLALFYFAALILAAPFTKASTPGKYRGVVMSVFVMVVAYGARALPASVRIWLPHLYLVAGYWIPALFVPPVPSPRFEAWLKRTDSAFPVRASIPPWTVHVIELSYMLCYVMVPAGLLVVQTFGTVRQVDRYWMSVLLAGYACYWSLPWLVSRPPRLLDEAAREHKPPVASLNARVLARVSHQLITFPSGHAAVSASVALATLAVWPAAGLAFLLLAVGIALGATFGRYHFLVDVLLGFVFGILSALVAKLLA